MRLIIHFSIKPKSDMRIFSKYFGNCATIVCNIYKLKHGINLDKKMIFK